MTLKESQQLGRRILAVSLVLTLFIMLGEFLLYIACAGLVVVMLPLAVLYFLSDLAVKRM